MGVARCLMAASMVAVVILQACVSAVNEDQNAADLAPPVGAPAPPVSKSAAATAAVAAQPASKPAAGAPAPGCPSLKQAHTQFLNKLHKLEKLEEQAQARAKKAELAAQEEKKAAERCLDAQKMLSGPARVARTKLMAKMSKATQELNKAHAVEMAKITKKWSTKIERAKAAEKARQDKRIASQLLKVKLDAKTSISKWKTKFKLLKTDMAKDAAAQKQQRQKLDAKLAQLTKEAMPVNTALTRAQKTFGKDAKSLEKANRSNAMAVRLLKTQLKAKSSEALSCQQALKSGISMHTGAGDADQPCPARMTHLLDQISTMKANSKRFRHEAVQDDGRLISTKVELKAANARIVELERKLRDQENEMNGMENKLRMLHKNNNLAVRKDRLHAMQAKQGEITPS